MRRAFLPFVAMALLVGCLCRAASPEEEARFEAAARAAFQQASLKQLEELTCWDRVPEARRAGLLKLYKRDLGFGARDVRLVDPDPRLPNRPWTKDGITYSSNLVVTKGVKITFGEGARFRDTTYLVGEKEGRLFMVAPAPVQK